MTSYKHSLLLPLCAAALLAACGGGGDDKPPATSQVPGSANESVTGLVAYLQELVVSMADMLEPVDTSGAQPPTDDTAEPTKVD